MQRDNPGEPAPTFSRRLDHARSSLKSFGEQHKIKPYRFSKGAALKFRIGQVQYRESIKDGGIWSYYNGELKTCHQQQWSFEYLEFLDVQEACKLFLERRARTETRVRRLWTDSHELDDAATAIRNLVYLLRDIRDMSVESRAVLSHVIASGLARRHKGKLRPTFRPTHVLSVLDLMAALIDVAPAGVRAFSQPQKRWSASQPCPELARFVDELASIWFRRLGIKICDGRGQKLFTHSVLTALRCSQIQVDIALEFYDPKFSYTKVLASETGWSKTLTLPDYLGEIKRALPDAWRRASSSKSEG